MCAIAILHETIVKAFNNIDRKWKSADISSQKLGFINIANISWAKRFFKTSLYIQMLKVNWCSSEIDRAKNRFMSIQFFYFLSRMCKNELNRKHQICTKSLCNFFQLDLITYQTKHRQSRCRCFDQGPNMNNVVTLLKNQKLSLLQITQTNENLENLKVKIVAYTPEISYITISHVWADGLENPKGNSAFVCQLSYIMKRINSLRDFTAFFAKSVTEASDIQDRSLLIWLDTFCCSISSKKVHLLVLAQMRSIYLNAKHVFLLDLSLQVYANDEIIIFEALYRFFLSKWMNRLWILQKIWLARTTWIQFKNRSIELDMLLLYLSRFDYADLAFYSFIFDSHAQFRTLKSRFFHNLFNKKSSKKSITMLFCELDATLQHRSITIDANKLLCMRNLLNLLADEVLKVSITSAAQMKRVWELAVIQYDGIPQMIIDFEQSRLIKKKMK